MPAELECSPNREDLCTCGQCKILRPKNAKHCSICGCCFTQLDHHCGFTGICIAGHNLRYFKCFVFSAMSSGSLMIISGVYFLADYLNRIGSTTGLVIGIGVGVLATACWQCGPLKMLLKPALCLPCTVVSRCITVALKKSRAKTQTQTQAASPGSAVAIDRSISGAPSTIMPVQLAPVVATRTAGGWSAVAVKN